jgi:hypothetical protein
MSEQDQPPQSLQPPVAETHPHLREFFTFLPEANKESDRGLVLISMSFIDDLMRRILMAFLIEGRTSTALVEGFNAPLGTLSTRSSAAYALGLISEREFQECERLRKIRNRFAHEIHISFDDSGIRNACRNLTMAAQDYGDVVVGPRGQFSTSSTALILNLTNRPAYVSRKRRAFEGWPY